MDLGIINEDTKVELEFLDGNGAKIGTSYSGIITEVLGEMEVTIHFSPGKGPLPSVYLGSVRVSAFFHHSLHGLLKFNGTITYKQQTGFGTDLKVLIDEDFKEIQKREYYRPICNAKAEYRLLKKSDDTTENDYPIRDARTRNISYTGVRILAEKTDEIAVDDEMDLNLWLKHDTVIKLNCKVLRVYEFDSGEKKNYDVGLSIESISDNDKKALVAYLTRSTMVRSLYWGESPF